MSQEKGEQLLLRHDVNIMRDVDVVPARQKARVLATQLGFSSTDQTAVDIAISEVARNIVTYAGHGEIALSLVQRDGRHGIIVVAHDEGPGIHNVEWALQDGHSTGEGLGLGLSGARRLMDEFEIVSQVGQGTTVTMRKWKQ
jgi:serine/threonine-protein kinase RsbT